MKKRFQSFWAFSLVLLLVLSACELTSPTKAPKSSVRYPNAVKSEMQAEFEQAESYFRSQNYKSATPAYQNYIQRHPYNRLTDQAQFRLGQILMLDRKYSEASALFAKLILKTPDPEMASRARVKAGINDYRLGNMRQALNHFENVQGQYLRGNDKVKAGGLALLLLNKTVSVEQQAYYNALVLDGYEGQSDEDIRSSYGEEAPTPAQAAQSLELWARSPATPLQIDKRFSAYPGSKSAPYIQYKLGRSYAAAGDAKKAKSYLEALLSKNSSFVYAAEAKQTLAQLGGAAPAAEKSSGGLTYKVGVILPLSGKYESFGVTTLKGVECAAGLKSGCHAVGNLQIVTRDDQGDPGTAVKAVEELVTQEKVHAIIGPLSSASAEPAAKKAQELGVAMISLAQKEGIPQVGPNIFRFSLTPDQQVEALLQYLSKKKDSKTLAVLYPSTNYGKVFFAKAKEMAPRYQVEIPASFEYASSRDVSKELRQIKAANVSAVFIPDVYASVLAILPQLKTHGLGALTLMGTNAWNDPNLLGKNEPSLANSVFLDVYFKDSKKAELRSFVEQFQSAYGQTPSTLEAMGYDTLRFLAEAMSKARVGDAAQVRGALMGHRGYDGVTGLKSFSENREAKVEPVLLTVQGGRMVELD